MLSAIAVTTKLAGSSDRAAAGAVVAAGCAPDVAPAGAAVVGRAAGAPAPPLGGALQLTSSTPASTIAQQRIPVIAASQRCGTLRPCADHGRAPQATQHRALITREW